MGPSFDPNICPKNAPLGEFSGNVAHSNGKYGLRIHHGHSPRTYPCKSITYDEATPLDPYHNNPLITAVYKDFTGWMNVENGAITEINGDVRFENFKIADNMIAGIEFSVIDDSIRDGLAQINNAFIVGHSANANAETLGSSPHGVITPRTENFSVNNVRLYNLDKNNMAGLGSCSHCFHPASTDSGARTVTFSNMFFDTTVT